MSKWPEIAFVPKETRVTARVTGYKAVLLNAIATTREIQKLTAKKLGLLDDLVHSLHAELRKEYADDQERLHRLEQAVQRLENAATGGRSAVPDGTPEQAPSAG